MSVRLHRGGRTRAWVGQQLGGDEALGDRIERRALHLLGAIVLAAYLLPARTFGPVPIDGVLLIGLAVVLVIEGFRWRGEVDLPTIRPHERQGIASYAYYAVGLVIAVLLFPEPVAVAIVLGAAVVDPLLGELRLWIPGRVAVSILGGAAYFGLALPALVEVGHAPLPISAGLAAVAASLAIAVEGPRSIMPVDDDLAMLLVPGIVLTVFFSVGPWATSL